MHRFIPCGRNTFLKLQPSARPSGQKSTFGSLEEGLPVGSGRCLDLGCGHGPHRTQITEAGYTWVAVGH